MEIWKREKLLNNEVTRLQTEMQDVRLNLNFKWDSQYLGYTYTKTLFTAHMKFSFNFTSFSDLFLSNQWFECVGHFTVDVIKSALCTGGVAQSGCWRSEQFVLFPALGGRGSRSL